MTFSWRAKESFWWAVFSYCRQHPLQLRWQQENKKYMKHFRAKWFHLLFVLISVPLPCSLLYSILLSLFAFLCLCIFPLRLHGALFSVSFSYPHPLSQTQYIILVWPGRSTLMIIFFSICVRLHALVQHWKGHVLVEEDEVISDKKFLAGNPGG